MKTIWVIVANQVEAQVYTCNGPPWNIELIRTLEHQEGAAYARDLVSDAPGRSHDRQGPGRHAIEPSTSAKQESMRKFVKEVTTLLDAAHLKHSFDELVIMAAPAMLGMIRKNLSSNLSRAVIKEIPKDVIGHEVEELKKHLQRAFELK